MHCGTGSMRGAFSGSAASLRKSGTYFSRTFMLSLLALC
jgi:hypothetical protein